MFPDSESCFFFNLVSYSSLLKRSFPCAKLQNYRAQMHRELFFSGDAHVAQFRSHASQIQCRMVRAQWISRSIFWKYKTLHHMWEGSKTIKGSLPEQLCLLDTHGNGKKPRTKLNTKQLCICIAMLRCTLANANAKFTAEVPEGLRLRRAEGEQERERVKKTSVVEDNFLLPGSTIPRASTTKALLWGKFFYRKRAK